MDLAVNEFQDAAEVVGDGVVGRRFKSHERSNTCIKTGEYHIINVF